MSHSSLSCRSCSSPLVHSVADLGIMPLANSYVPPESASEKEASFPLHAYVCHQCWLVQVPPQATPEAIFSHYAYFSGFSHIWKEHCKKYASEMISRFALSSSSLVVEIASNDGTLLQGFKENNIQVLGIEPAQNIAAYANEHGIPTRASFFGKETAQKLVAEGIRADVMAANNVLAHVPDIHDFVAGFTLLLKPEGVITFEFPHVLEMLKQTQFDTIYHEHFSYLSLTALQPIFHRHGLKMVDIEKLSTHGGSLRVFLMHENASAKASPSVEMTLQEEENYGLTSLKTYEVFAAKVQAVRIDLLHSLQALKAEGKKVAAYGAPAKGNTLLNYCGIGTEFLAYTVDKNPHKQGYLLPGSHLPIHSPDHLLQDKPDVVLILPWNIADEIMQEMQQIKEWGGRFMTAIPNVRYL